jgi:hypothetical protein
MTPAVLAQMQATAPMRGAGGAPNNMDNNNWVAPDEMPQNGPMSKQTNDQMMECNTFGSLRRNFDVETKLPRWR